MINYEVYIDESGLFREGDEVSVVAGFAYQKRQEEQFSFSTTYKNIISKCVSIINGALAKQGVKRIDIDRDRQAIHTTLTDNDRQILYTANADERLKQIVNAKMVLRKWVEEDPDFIDIINNENMLIVSAYGWPSDTDNSDFRLEGFYRHMLRSLMERVSHQLRMRHPGEEVEILFCIPTRKVYVSDEDIIKEFEAIGLRCGDGFDINLSQSFLQAQEELDMQIVCRKIEYSIDRASNDDAIMLGSSWGYYLADWICAWALKKILVGKKSPVSITFDSFFVGKLSPIVIAYSSAYNKLIGILRNNLQDPLRYLALFGETIELHNPRISCCASLMKDEHPFSNSRILRDTIELITTKYNSASNPIYSEAVKYYRLLLDIVDNDVSVSSSLYADLCKNLLICYQYNGDSQNSWSHFRKCFQSKRDWSQIDILSLISIFSETYVNLLAFNEAEEMVEWALAPFSEGNYRAQLSGRWLNEIDLDESRILHEQAGSMLSLAMACAFQKKTGQEARFEDSISSLSRLGDDDEANIARFHYIHYLLQIKDFERIPVLLNAYFANSADECSLTSCEVWKKWLDDIVTNNDGEPDRMRFPLWLYMKCLYSFWEDIDEDGKIELLIYLFDDERIRKGTDIVMDIKYHPIEEILIYRALLAVHVHRQTAIQYQDRLLSLADEKGGIIGIICRIGVIRIRLETGELEPTSRKNVHFMRIKQNIRKGIIDL